MGIDDARREIDEIDRQIALLLNRRAEVAASIGKLKARSAAEVYDPVRENQVLANVVDAARGPLDERALRLIYGEILSACRALQRELRVGYLGPEAAFTHEAALRRFGGSASFVASRTIEDVFAMTQRGAVDYGVVPIENSTAGAVISTLDVFLSPDLVGSGLQICSEIELPVSLNLLAGGRLEDVRRVYSKAEALAQCRRWLSDHLPQAERLEVESTARAAQMAAAEAGAGAIGTEAAARTYGLRVAATGIQDAASNVTRFLVIGSHRGQRGPKNKTAIVFSVRHEVGALRNALDTLARYGLNMTRIESRPSRQELWEYVFFVDIIGHPEDDNVTAALGELGPHCAFLKVLGAWPID